MSLQVTIVPDRLRPELCPWRVKYKNFGSPGTKVLCHRIYRGRMPRRFPWRWHFHFWIHKLRCCLIFFHSYKQETLNSPKIMTIDEKFSISINCIQTMGGRFQFSYLRPAFVFEHFFVQVRIWPTKGSYQYDFRFDCNNLADLFQTFPCMFTSSMIISPEYNDWISKRYWCTIIEAES